MKGWSDVVVHTVGITSIIRFCDVDFFLPTYLWICYTHSLDHSFSNLSLISILTIICRSLTFTKISWTQLGILSGSFRLFFTKLIDFYNAISCDQLCTKKYTIHIHIIYSVNCCWWYDDILTQVKTQIQK